MNSNILAAVLAAVFMGTIGAISVYADVSAETVTFYRLFIGAVLMGGAVHSAFYDSAGG